MYYERCKNFSPQQAVKFQPFLLCRQSTFVDPEMPLQCSAVGEHRINFNDETPFKEPLRRVPIFKQGLLHAEILK